MRLRTIRLISVLSIFLVNGGTYSAKQNASSSGGTQTAVPSRVRFPPEVVESRLVKRVDPVYPAIAKTTGVSGTVILHVIIGKDGSVQSVDFISGPQVLLAAAMDAVRQWHYAPILLNGRPVEIDTTVLVAFPPSGDVRTDSSIPSTIDPQFKTDVMKLLEVTGYHKTALRVAEQSFESTRAQSERSWPDLPDREALIDAYRDKILSLLQSPELDDKIATVYAKYLSDDDVKNLIQFYESPAGQHFSSVEVALEDDLGQAAIQLGREHIGEINKEFCGEHPELKGKISFCPSQP